MSDPYPAVPGLEGLTHSGIPESDDPGFRSTVALDEMMGQTVLTMKAVFDSVEARDLVVEKYNAIEGGNQTLGRLEAFLAAPGKA